ncbi:Detected protein of confused Function [Hibiscus syriacus]|uniref:Detected protein of confused Function n=1 Tax=Hibiscus syriacus TaxID=106335 RepID=A0A6A3AFB3_HIBSY|nr:Detected protein of confused Function [Hibiscus syriacus]
MPKCNFGIAFDIDGVILLGRVPIGGSPQARRRLYGDSGEWSAPYLFLTNGGDVPETKRSKELRTFGSKYYVFSGCKDHSALNELIIAIGKGDPALVMSEMVSTKLFSARKVTSFEQLAMYFENIDPVSQYKRWTAMPLSDRKGSTVPIYEISSVRVKATFVIRDPVDWGRDIQVFMVFNMKSGQV